MKLIIFVIILYNIITIKCDLLDGITKNKQTKNVIKNVKIVNDLPSFEKFVSKYNKTYKTDNEKIKANENYINSLNQIIKHNELFANNKVPYELGINSYSDMSTKDINKKINGYKHTVTTKNEPVDLDVIDNPPDNIDWSKKGYVTEVTSQRICASCWAFSALGCLEGQLYKKYSKLIQLSPQNLIDCDYNEKSGNWGCNGGEMELTFKYIKMRGGVNFWTDYPYKGRKGDICNYNKNNLVGTIESIVKIPPNDEELLKRVVAAVGPLSVAIDASLSTFQLYKSGLYYDVKCNRDNVNHAVLLVGYGTDENGQDYWLIKNSYGLSWGINGYAKIARNKDNHCGIADYAIYPKI